MTVFKTYDELYICFSRLYDRARRDPRIAPKIRDSRLIIQFRFDDPLAIATINATLPASDTNAYYEVFWGDTPGWQPDIELRAKADIAHLFWQGKINLMTALARGQIIAKGPLSKIIKLLPTIEPMYQMYPQILREIGREDLIIP